MKKEKYKKIAAKYGDVASWAVWTPAGDTPKSNISDMSVFDPDLNPELLDILKPNVVMTGLNFARDVKFEKPFMNFHDPNPRAQDYKIRNAFTDTEFYGAYMTDVIKNTPMLSSNDLMKYLKKNSTVVKRNLESFSEELNFIGAENPVILAFGNDAYNILKKHLDPVHYGKLIKLLHYSYQISQNDYRKKVHEVLGLTT